LDDNFLAVLRDFTAGDPMRQGVIWTNLTPAEIALRLGEKGTPVSVPVVQQLLERHGYVRRKAQKRLSQQQHKNRDQQFQIIARLRAEYLASANPILSIDTKKKEFLGNLYRDGKLFTREELRTLDHDFPSDAEGVIIPHGLYDLKRNHGHINLGESHDTSRFACDSIGLWWHKHGLSNYPRRRSSCCCATAVAVTQPTATCSRPGCKNWPTGWAKRFAWPTTRRGVPSTTRSNTDCSRTSREPARE
jgi:hypothetical protein